MRRQTLRGGVLVTFVQGIVRTFDENLSPLDQAGCEKSRNDAEDYFLHEGRVHSTQ